MSFFTNDIKAKDTDRRKIEQHLQAFFAASGEIQRPQSGKHKALSMRAHNDATWARKAAK